MDQEILKSVVTTILERTPKKPFLCLPMSAMLYAILNDNKLCEAKLVTGNLRFDNEYIFKQDFKISDAKPEAYREWTGHAWVKTDEYLIDLSIFRTLYSPKFTKPFRNKLVEALGSGKGCLIIPTTTLEDFSLKYEQKDELSDELVTGIIKGAEHLFAK